MDRTFPLALTLLMEHEGGYGDDPQDPGGATNYGVTLRTFRNFYGQHLTEPDLQQITPAQVRHIYLEGYWRPCRCPALPVGVDYAVFDGAVLSGQRRSVLWLQAALFVPVDGVLGPRTLAAAQAQPLSIVLRAMEKERLAFLKGLTTWPHYGGGWEPRVKHVTKEALWLAQYPVK